MIHKTAKVPLWGVVVGVFVALSVVQYFVSIHTATVFSVVMVAFAFTFKSWVNFVSAYTMYRQHGTSTLARACHRYFWALLGMSGAFALLFWLATADSVRIVLPGTDLAEVRNSLRNLAIASIVAVIITGSQMMDALSAYLREQIARKDVQSRAKGATYIEQVATEIWRATGEHAPQYPEHEAGLWLGYAVLALSKGIKTTSRDVHDAWSAWAVQAYPYQHRSAIPFNQLSPEIQGYDDEYRDAIHRVAMRSAEAP